MGQRNLALRISNNRQVKFGLKYDGQHCIAVVLPQFNLSKCTLNNLHRIAIRLNRAKKSNQGSHAERILRENISDNISTRVTTDNGNLIAFSETAASILLKMGLPILKEQYYVPI